MHRAQQLEQDKVLLQEKMERVQLKMKEKWDSDAIAYVLFSKKCLPNLSLKGQHSAEKRKLVEEITLYETKCTDLQSQMERAVRDKRSAENELEKMTRHIPGQVDQLEMTIDELNTRLRSSERERIEALHQLES